ncbi:MAG: ethanolamine utilization protein EutP [Firmicutes bacterium HGW-Firmicutes-7]|nr:MAG: ethanolamine utilization protein EutP [Firmicutes bacterium HGW-Firmicutes-7]
MKKIILIGAVGCGKTTFVQAMVKASLKYKKTQAMEYYDNIIDTPGEYLESRRFNNALIVASCDCHVVLLLQDASGKSCLFPPNFASVFVKPVIGIVTKVDEEIKDIEYARNCLTLAGVKKIFEISATKGLGLEELENYLE